MSHQSAGGGADEKFVLVLPGENFYHISQKLYESGLIANDRIFRYYLRFSGLSAKIKVGEYALKANMTNSEIAHILASGRSVLHKFTVPEGNNKFQIAEDLQSAGLGKKEAFLKAVVSKPLIQSLALPTVVSKEAAPPSLEGYLYPDTYMISRLMDEEEIVRMMVKHFKEVFAELQPELSKYKISSKYGLTEHELIILASMVEKETGAGKERPIIAGVFYNRIHKGMRMQSDPTTIYGIWDRDGHFDGKIHSADLHTDTPYNTYTVPRLPLGPIANPGKDAILAAINPADSVYLYFVSRNDGTHVFTQNYGEHQKAVNILQKDPHARDGKSWRDLPASERANKRKI